MTERFTTFLRSVTAAAALVSLLPTPEAQAQFTVYYGGEMVYSQAVGMPDSAILVHPSQERDFSTVGGEIPDASQAVDLGLPSGTLWAPWNVGASSVGEAGDYFAWGEVQAGYRYKYDWGHYWWMAKGKSDWEYITKYHREDGKTSAVWYGPTGSFVGDGKTTLDPEDDAAAVNWGDTWRMPTRAELAELSNRCKWVWYEENEYATGSLAGYKLIGPNGNTIFLPAAGSRGQEPVSVSGRGTSGDYWSSELNSDYSDTDIFLGSDHSGYAIYLDFYHGRNWRLMDGAARCTGRSVRAVCSASE